MEIFVLVGMWEMCCERMGADPGETEGVPGEVWSRRKYNLDGGKSTSICR